MIPTEKKNLAKRASEIIRNYLYDTDESYAYITMYFEKSNGEKQAKRLVFGNPSKNTPDLARDYPHGFIDTNEPFNPIGLDEILTKKVMWVDFNGNPWNGISLSQIRKNKKGV